jgi:glycerophosphoryl diester phosphodiesterase
MSTNQSGRFNAVSKRPFFVAAPKDRPDVIAHRGGAGEWPGETILAFEKAIKHGVDVLEMDVRRTKDDEIILMHNGKVDKTTDGHGHIRALTLAELKKLNAAARWATNPIFKHIEIPSLPEVFDLLKDYPKIRLNIEIKDRDRWLAEKVGAMITQRGFADRVLLASGWDSVVEVVRDNYPNIASSASVLEIITFQICDNILGVRAPLKRVDALQWHSRMLKLKIITPRFVERAHSRGLIVHAWTVNEPEEMARMIDLGVDGIITDYPSTLLKLFP